MKTRTSERRPSSPTARAKAREDAQAKVVAALERLDAAIVTVCESDSAFREYLRLSGRMHRYSWGNRLLIGLQRPDTAMVAGYQRWRELGRPVKKGAKGIQILAPMVVKQTIDPSLGADRETATISAADDRTVSKVVGFRLAYVFAVEDTDGDPIGRPQPTPETDDSYQSACLAQALQAAASALSISVDIRCSDSSLGTGVDGSPAGWADLTRREIVVNGDLPAAARAKTLAHEIAHQLADHLTSNDDRRDAEAIAEGAAFIVAAHYNLDTTTYSAPYIAGWAQDPTRVRRLLERIGHIATQIIDHTDHQPEIRMLRPS